MIFHSYRKKHTEINYAHADQEEKQNDAAELKQNIFSPGMI